MALAPDDPQKYETRSLLGGQDVKRSLGDTADACKLLYQIFCFLLSSAVVLSLAALHVFLPGIFVCVFHRAICGVTCVGKAEPLQHWQGCCVDFDKCLERLPLGANGIPFGDLLLSQLSTPSYINLTGIPVDGKFNYNQIISEGQKMPGKLYAGEWWRGNELGGVVHNPYFWSGLGIWPMSIGMGITEQQHSAIRKATEEAFSLPMNEGWIRSGLRRFFKERADAGELKVMEDLSIWVHQVLMNSTFGWSVDYAYAKDFVKVQRSLMDYGVISQIVPAQLYSLGGNLLPMEEIKDAMTTYVESFIPLVEARWGDSLKMQNCSPSPTKSCSVQLASTILDSFLLGGGHFLPFGIRSGLAILYSNSSSNPRPGAQIPRGQELAFFWECLRFIPPVLGIPHWREERPMCAGMTAQESQMLNQPQGKTAACPMLENNHWTGYPPVNQWKGGHRYVLGILLGQLDPRIWGEGADSEFRVRTVEEYNRLSVGFAEMMVDNYVNSGRSNRNCPAKQLALLFGRIFFEELDVDAWEPSSADIFIDSRSAAKVIPQFTLLPKKSKLDK